MPTLGHIDLLLLSQRDASKSLLDTLKSELTERKEELGSESYFICINPKIVPNAFSVLIACYQAVLLKSRNKMKHSSLHDNVYFRLSNTGHRDTAISQISAKSDDTSILVAIINASAEGVRGFASLFNNEEDGTDAMDDEHYNANFNDDNNNDNNNSNTDTNSDNGSNDNSNDDSNNGNSNDHKNNNTSTVGGSNLNKTNAKDDTNTNTTEMNTNENEMTGKACESSNQLKHPLITVEAIENMSKYTDQTLLAKKFKVNPAELTFTATAQPPSQRAGCSAQTIFALGNAVLTRISERTAKKNK